MIRFLPADVGFMIHTAGEEMLEIAKVFAWPLVVIIVALIFREPITALINRTKKVGRAGIETSDPQPQVPQTDRRAIEKPVKPPDNPLVEEAAKKVRKELDEAQVMEDGGREEALTRALAQTRILLHFETVNGLIWRSQVLLLNYLIAFANGIGTTLVEPFYQNAKQAWPIMYASYSFDDWLGFLKGAGFVEQNDANVCLNVAGREFLKFRIDARKAVPFHG